MTAINKFRIVGPRYKQQTRIYKDETFTFSSVDGPQNAIITAKNTFGKGVLLQLLFQPIIPKTSWNRGKNKVNHFFYASKGQFRPYTFYSCIEFHLDLNRHLLVGIAMTSHLNEEKDSEPLYTLFVREYRISLYDPFTIDSLPLYNVERATPVPYDEFLDYLKENKKEFLTFNEGSKSKFYTALDSYGIIRKDWEQLIDINQYEGGVAHYFDDKKATSNHGLFSNMIIPALEARLNEAGGENDLITLFKNIASITKNLPELKKNAATYAEIKNHNEEVRLSLTELMEEKDRFNIHIQNGRSLLTALENEVEVLKSEINAHKGQLEELRKLKRELEWKQQNLLYVIQYYERNKVNNRLISLKSELNEKVNQKIAATSDLENAQLDFQLRKWHEKESELQEVRRKIEAIEQSQEYKDSIEIKEQLEVEINREWNTVLKKIQKISTESVLYKNHLDHQRDSINQQIVKYQKEHFGYEVAKGVIDLSIQKFEEELVIQKEHYGEYFLNDMEKILAQKREELKHSEESHSLLTIKQQSLNEDKTKLNRSHAALETEIKSLQKDVKTYKQQWEHQENKELTLKEKVWKALRINPVQVDDFRKWLSDQIPVLKKRKNEWEINLDQLNIEFYELAFEVKQNDSPFLIPNEELYKVKTTLSEKGVPVIYGDEYIKQQDQAKREELNRIHPLLKYGLIVPTQNKIYLDEIRKQDREFFHTPIPIFWVNQLEQLVDLPFLVLDQKATEVSIYEDKLLERKQNLLSKGDNLGTEINSTRAYLNQLTTVVAELESFDDAVISIELEKIYLSTQENLIQKVKDEADICKQISIIDQEMIRASEAIESVNKTIGLLKSENEKLEKWIADKQIYEDEKRHQYEITLKIQGIYSKLDTKHSELSEFNKMFDGWNESYDQWNKKKEHLIKNVSKVIPKIYIEKTITQNTQNNPPVFNMEEMKLKEWLSKWEVTQQEISIQNIELVRLRTHLEHFQKAVREEENELYQLNKDWSEYPIPEEYLPVLNVKVDSQKQHVESINERILGLNISIKHEKDQQHKLNQALDEQKDFLEEEFKRQPEVWEMGDFSKMKIGLRQALSENSKDTNDTVEIINITEIKIHGYNIVYQKIAATLNALNVTTGVLPSPFIQDLVKKDPEKTGGEWIHTVNTIKKTVENKKTALQNIHRKKKDIFEQSDWASEIGNVALKVYSDMDFEELDEVKASIEGLNLLAANEIAEAEDERNTAEEAKKEWVEHACKYALQIVEHLRKMIKAMRVTNRNGLIFPLVKFKRENLLPKEIDQIKGNIDDLFDRVITEIFAEFQDIKDIAPKVLKDKISTKTIIYAALNYQYPVLWLYRLHEENSFLYEPPREEFYTEWETINESSKTDPSGSGGQLFSARTLILMMLTSFKRTNDDNSNWKLLITDNPFSVAVSDHIVDPIIAIAEELKFQWIAVTPPELVKIELLQKFDVYYQLSAKEINNSLDQVVSEVQYGYRNYKRTNRILNVRG